MKKITHITFLALPLTAGMTGCQHTHPIRPNILFVIADDQSYPHASAYGSTMVSTPGFDLVARQGALFSNFYVTSPGSSPSRASMLTGLYPWQIAEAGTHASSFPADYACFPDLLRGAGYLIGYTGKGWGPGDWQVSGRPYNPAGPEYNECRLEPPYTGISKIDYTANFKKFLGERSKGQPFCFWLGTHEPHRPFEEGSWEKAGMSSERASVPGFLPGTDLIRGDLLDYAVEIGWFDRHLMNCIDELVRIGEFDNTIIIVTADNGMSFPHAKANCYDPGIHVPLAVCWGARIKPGQIIDALTSGVDFFPTVLDAAEVPYADGSSGQSLLPLMYGRRAEYTADAVYSGRERHSSSRYDNRGYPVRSIRWENYLLVRNFHPERWPAGDPREIGRDGEPGRMHGAYHDIDAAPSKSFLLEFHDDPSVKPYFDAAVAKRNEYELFDLKNDPACMHDVSGDASYRDVLVKMRDKLTARLIETGDPRMGGDPEIWESYPRIEGKMRYFPQPELTPAR